jgi:hypothetical protein
MECGGEHATGTFCYYSCFRIRTQLKPNEVGVSSCFGEKSAARRSPMDVILGNWDNLKLTLLTVTCQIGEGHSVVEILS